MICPKPLFKGARVALIAPSSPISPERLDPTVKAVEAMGLNPVVYESCKSSHGYLSGEDRVRADDVNAAFTDPSIDGILCIRGGYGAQRLMKRIDFECIAQNPKFFAGYSDITALHIQINQKCGFMTYHMPMPATEFALDPDEFTMGCCEKMMFGTPYGVLENPADMPVRTLVEGKAQGILTGGNLSLVASSLGTPYEIDTRGKILFLEDIYEEPYSVDRMLNQLRMAGKFRDCAGILLGYWTKCEAKDPQKSLTLEQVFQELLVPEGKPVLADLACGHSLPSLALPLGACAEFDACEGRVRILKA